MRVNTHTRVERLRYRDELNPSQVWYSTSGHAKAKRVLDERNPTVNSSGPLKYYPSFNHEFLQDQKSEHLVERFLGPGNYDSDPDGILGKWAVRVAWIYVTYVFRVATPTADYGDATAQLEIWLLDQYFDYTTITWNNQPAWTGARARVTYSTNAYNTPSYEGVFTGGILFDDIPLSEDGYPMPVYGVGAKATILSGDSHYFTRPSSVGPNVGRARQAGREADPIYIGEYMPL